MTLLTLDEVSRRTDQPERRLRNWCATGLLACERENGAWMLPEDELPRVAVLVAERGRAPADRQALALAVPTESAPDDLVRRIESELGIPAGSVAMTTLVIDGEEHLVAVWPSGATLAARGAALQRLADDLDADILRIGSEPGVGSDR